MENNAVSYRKLGGWLLVIFVFGILNAIGDTVLLLRSESFFAAPVILVCNILFIVFIAIRRLLLFKIFFFAACILALIHLLVNLITAYPQTVFEIMLSMNMPVFFTGIIKPMLGLLKAVYPVFLVLGTALSFGILFVLFVYFKRSKRVAAYFAF